MAESNQPPEDQRKVVGVYDRPASAEHYGHIDQDLPAQFERWRACAKPVVLTGHGHVPRVYGVQARADARLEDVVTSIPDPKDARTVVPMRRACCPGDPPLLCRFDQMCQP